jgi:hypothetical protein
MRAGLAEAAAAHRQSDKVELGSPQSSYRPQADHAGHVGKEDREVEGADAQGAIIV